MASRPKTHNPAAAARRRSLGAVILLSFASIAAAEPSTLQANPGGSLSIETPIQAANAGTEQTERPVAGPPMIVAEALEIAPDPAPASEQTTEEAQPAEPNPEASKPLGGGASISLTQNDDAEATTTQGGGWFLRTALALAAVIGLILLCKMAFLKLARQGGGSLAAQLGASGRAPSGLLSVLARYPVAKGSTLVLLRLDRRVLLLSQTGQGFSTLAEIDDPEEVAALIMRAEDEEGASLTRRFRTMLTQAESDPGLIGERDYEIDPAVPMTPRAATARFHEIAMEHETPIAGSEDDHADAVGSLRNRLRSLREVTA